jgi:ceramide glucosyltransferase
MRFLTYFVEVIGFAGVAYQVVAILAALTHKVESTLRRRRPQPAALPAISILKPITGLEEGLEEALLSHIRQDYPEFEILCGVPTLDDPAVPLIRELIAKHPAVALRLIECKEQRPNAKVAILLGLEPEARHAVLLVNDSDITVPRDYLRRVAGRLVLDQAGLVTCLYRATAHSAAGVWEAFGISIDFVPSTLVAPLVGIREFGLGSTLCFHREDLERAGGFEAIAGYIADDYQLAKRITALGRPAIFAEVVVETDLGSPTWREVWLHQVRWARTIRVSRGGGFLGLPVTHAGMLIVLAVLTQAWMVAAMLWLARMVMAFIGGFLTLDSWLALLLVPLAPLWDLWAFAVWLAAYCGRTVAWRGERYKLSRDGALERLGE